MVVIDSFRAQQVLQCGEQQCIFHSLNQAAMNGAGPITHLPFSRKILLENLLCHEDGVSVTSDDIRAAATLRPTARDIPFHPRRVLMQDNNAVPALVDLAAMREAMVALGRRPEDINPVVPVDLVIDHSVSVDHYATVDAASQNLKVEYERHQERYRFLKWAQNAFDKLRVIPPGTGICHQINLEFLSRVVRTDLHNGHAPVAHFDTVVGTDSHTTMVNGLGVLGWGVGGIEAEAVMLGLPIAIRLPEVIGIRLSGHMRANITATDLALTLTERLRKYGVVGAFIEFLGPGLQQLSVTDRATIANMAPEYGATCAFFPIDAQTTAYLRTTGRDEQDVSLVETYAKAQGLWCSAETPEPHFSDVIEFPLDKVCTSISGPRRPEDRVTIRTERNRSAPTSHERGKSAVPERLTPSATPIALSHGDVVIAAITSCTNTSNPRAMVAAGILARNAAIRGLCTRPWVKTSLAPGSRVVAAYLRSSGLQEHLDALGFQVVGFGCTTCIGNSGALLPAVQHAIDHGMLNAAAVLSGNRNFEGRIHPAVREAYLASPPLVVAYALAGTIAIDFTSEPIGYGNSGEPVYLEDIWPSEADISTLIQQTEFRELFQANYRDIFSGSAPWKSIGAGASPIYDWHEESTYFKLPPYFTNFEIEPQIFNEPIQARILGIFGDSINTDQISPAGSIPAASPAGLYLQSLGVRPEEFNTYAARRGHHEIILRGTFANPRIRNLMLKGEDSIEGSFTLHFPSRERTTIFDAAMRYRQDGVPAVIFAGRNYGAGSSRDWAAKGTKLLGIHAVIAESFERIHRSNLIGMGVLPLSFTDGMKLSNAELAGDETVRIPAFDDVQLGESVAIEIEFPSGKVVSIPVKPEIDTPSEIECLRHGGILPLVLRKLARARTE